MNHVSVSPTNGNGPTHKHLHLTSASAAFADDIKFYRAINNPEHGERLQQDHKQVCDWCELWHIDLNIGKCCLLSFTGNTNSYRPSYHLDDMSVICQ